jgi:hypothetical protein
VFLPKQANPGRWLAQTKPWDPRSGRKMEKRREGRGIEQLVGDVEGEGAGRRLGEVVVVGTVVMGDVEEDSVVMNTDSVDEGECRHGEVVAGAVVIDDDVFVLLVVVVGVVAFVAEIAVVVVVVVAVVVVVVVCDAAVVVWKAGVVVGYLPWCCCARYHYCHDLRPRCLTRCFGGFRFCSLSLCHLSPSLTYFLS